MKHILSPTYQVCVLCGKVAMDIEEDMLGCEGGIQYRDIIYAGSDGVSFVKEPIKIKLYSPHAIGFNSNCNKKVE